MQSRELDSDSNVNQELAPVAVDPLPAGEPPLPAFNLSEKIYAWGRWILVGNPFYPLSSGSRD